MPFSTDRPGAISVAVYHVARSAAAGDELGAIKSQPARGLPLIR